MVALVITVLLFGNGSQAGEELSFGQQRLNPDLSVGVRIVEHEGGYFIKRRFSSAAYHWSYT